jgi:TP901 family phage tail tape measure protein|nr:MAG TPA: minor tail protein [Caudoviricetes sp.]
MSINVGTAAGYLDLDASKFKAGLKDAQSTLSEFTNISNSAGTRFEALGSSLKSVGGAITKTVSLPLLALGAGALKVAGDFEAGMSEVSAITGATGKDMQALEKQAKTLGATTKFSARDAAEGMKYFGMAGYDTNQIMSALPSTLNLAAAGNVDLGIACDIVSDAMTGLGMSANETTKFTDIMAATITNSNTSVELMGETLKYVGPVAGTLGIGMGDLSVAIGLMGNAGIKGSQAGTALRAGLTNLVKPTKEMKTAMEKYGVELVKNADGSVNMMGTMENLRSTLGGLDQATQAQALATIFGKEAMSAWASVVNASEGDFNKLSDAIANSDGKASDMANTMQNNLKGSIDNMKSAFEGLLITIGERLIPVFRSLVDGITGVFTWFNNLNPVIQNIIIGVGGFLAVLGPLLLIVGNVIIFVTKLGMAISTLVTFFSAGGAGAGLLATAIAFLTGPIGLTIAAITALIAIGVLLYKNWDEIKAKASEIWNGIKDTIMNAMNWLGEQLGFNTEEIFAVITDTWNSIKDTLGATLDVISKTVSDAWEGIKEVLEMTVGVIFTTVKKAWDDIKDALSMIGDAIQQLINGDWEGAKETIRQMNEKIKEIVSMAWNKIKATLSQAGEAIKNIAEQSWNKIKVTLSQAMENIKTAISNGWENIKNSTKTAFDNVKAIISTIFNGIKSDIQSKINEIKNVISTVWSGLKDLLTAPFIAAKGVIDNILSGISSAISTVSNAISSVKNAASSVIDKINPFKRTVQFDYIVQDQPVDNYKFRSEALDLAKTLAYSDRMAKTSIAESISNVTRSASKMSTGNNSSELKANGGVVINNNQVYTSPKPASIRELKRQDEIQMRRLAMQLGF